MADTTDHLPTTKPLAGIKKAAIVLVALGPTDSAKVLKCMPEEDADKVAKAIAQLDRVGADEVELALEEFSQFTTSEKLYMKGGFDYASKVISEAYEPKIAKALIERLMKSMTHQAIDFENFRKTDPLQLSKFIQDEHPQTIALILSHLDPGQAAALITCLSPDLRTDVATRMADLEQISPEIVRNIASVIDQKVRNLGELSREAYGGVKAVANIFNRLDPNTCASLMTAFEQHNPTLFENIRSFMFVFKDLEELEMTAITALIARANRSTLIIALKGANDSLQKKFLSTQSQRGAAMMTEDIAALGPTKLRDVDTAQQEIIALAREMEKEGIISLKNSADEQYV
ncbi:MAG: flagellar motor switch protein FliG [Bryobacteraceae bacterium]